MSPVRWKAYDVEIFESHFHQSCLYLPFVDAETFPPSTSAQTFGDRDYFFFPFSGFLSNHFYAVKQNWAEKTLTETQVRQHSVHSRSYRGCPWTAGRCGEASRCRTPGRWWQTWGWQRTRGGRSGAAESWPSWWTWAQSAGLKEVTQQRTYGLKKISMALKWKVYTGKSIFLGHISLSECEFYSCVCVNGNEIQFFL